MSCDLTIEEPICIPRGATFDKVFDVFDATVEPNVPIDLTDRNWRSQVRERVDSPDPPLAEWLSTGGSPEILIEDIPGEVAGNNGRLRIRVGATTTETYLFDAGVYDLEGELIADADDVWRLSQGDVEVSPEVTR